MILASLVLSIIFAYKNFIPVNVAKFFLFSFIAISVHLFAQKFIAKKHGCSADLEIWKMKRYWFHTKGHFPKKINLFFTKIVINNLPIGIILPLLVSFLSDGQIFFAAAFTTSIVVRKGLRLGKKYKNLTDYESAKIAIFGPIANILLAAVLSIFSLAALQGLIFVNSMLAIFTMIPLPGLAGATVFFGSKPLYVFGYSFILVLALLLNFITPYAAALIALVAGIAALLSYLFLYELKIK